MRILFTILILFTAQLVTAQSSFLKEAVNKFEKALVTRDTVVLKQLLHKDLNYGHSNAWVESKSQLIENLYNGKMIYREVQSTGHQWSLGRDYASLRTTTTISYLLDNKPGALTLHVLQVWIRTNKGWQLLARQSTKAGEN